ncbi:motility associated factor glycosyltransferase family protein [Campylobacter subantarcticus]|uniref:Motility accessory factor n=1 Tax=Campylobacter subantarcticus LMG 24374 TaxID=1388751 RepID=A0A0A8H7H1_9BACT|nr:motility accessory factor [Campylobacter subantarcticus]AJC90073.1 motility accessory factor [Campylobacter subantarcticus LMG 24374]EAJ1261847.1 motility accessory factor [Campylobacter lari]
MDKTLFKKNISALNENFQTIFKNIKKTKYKILQGRDSLDINIIDERGEMVYENALIELNSKLNFYHQNYKLHPVLYFYGFGNGILYKAFLQNPNLKHIVVFERDFELIYLLFFYIDFSQELKQGKLIIAEENPQNCALLALMSKNPFREFIRTYFLEPHCKYYEQFEQNILNLNQKMYSIINSINIQKGTSTQDTLQGIDQFIQNIPTMLSKPCLKELLNKRKAKAKNAIIVSTGPSLSKQLPLLKQYQENVVIFCADSAYSILQLENIKPDYVFMVERSDFTAEFFNNDFKDFDKDIIFILTSLVHPNALKYLEKNNRKFMLISKETFETYFKLNAFGYVDYAISVAHLAFIAANLLEFKNIIFIGQDLAYNDLGESHPKNYKHSATYESQMDKFNTIAYGGKGFVKTHIAWDMFRVNLEHLFALSKAKIYNATEGGARIEGSIEKPFKTLCETLLKEKIDKNFERLDNLKYTKKQEYLLKAYHQINLLLKDITHYLQKYTDIILFIKDNFDNFSKIIQFLNDFDLDDFKNNELIKLLLACYLDQMRFVLAKIYTIIPSDENILLQKNQAWINLHLEYFQLIVITLESLKNLILQNKKIIENELLKNDLEKYIKN